MTNLVCKTNTENGHVSISAEPLGKGGEGSVYSVEKHDLDGLPPATELVAKIYHAPNEGNRLRKIVTMVKTPPESDALAWPLAVLLTPSGAFQGYLMPKLAMDKYRMWASFTQGAERKRTSEKFDVRYALVAALNLAIALEAVHDAGHFVGDVNESNIFVGSDASVLLVDTDSAQISTPDGKIFPCLVGKPEYTAAELSRGKLKDHKRTEASDTFAFGVAVYQLLMNGAHPTDGVYKGQGEPPAVVDRIRVGVLPNLRKEREYSSVDRVPTVGMPKKLVPMFESILNPEPKTRMRLAQVIDVIDDVCNNLKQCSKVKQHWYDARDRKCGWCEHVKQGQVDPWTLNLSAKQKREQKKLNSLKFQDSEASAKAPRAPRAPVNSPGGGTSGSHRPQRRPASRAQRKSAAAQQKAFAASQVALGTLPPLSDVYNSPRISMDKVKGKTVLQWADGTVAPRPALSVLADKQPKIAYRCFVNELPASARLHWKVEDAAPTVPALVIGLLISFFIAGFWVPVTGYLLEYVPQSVTSYLPWKLIEAIFPNVVAGTASTATIVHFASALRERYRIKKETGVSANEFTHLSIITTVFRLGITTITYGIPLFIALLLGLFLGIINFIAAMFSSGR